MREVRRTKGRPQQAAIADVKFLFRTLRGVLSPVAWDDWGDHYPDRAVAADRADIIRLVESAEGDRSAACAAHWFDRQPEGFHVVRGARGSLRGVVAVLDLTAASTEERDADPGTAAAWRFVQRTAPARVGEVVTQCRFTVDAETYQGPSPTLNAVPIVTMQRELTTPHLAWDLVTLADPDRWNEYFAAADLPRAVGADFLLGGRRFGLFAHDFRRVPLEAVTERWTERALADDALLLPPAPTASEPLVLSHGDFEAAVRQAMKDLHRPELLERNPLLRTRLVTTRAEASGARGPDRAPACRGRGPRGRPAGPRAPSGAGRDLPPHVPHPGVRRSDPGPAVQHLPPAPPPRTPASRGLAVGAGAGHRWTEVDTT